MYVLVNPTQMDSGPSRQQTKPKMKPRTYGDGPLPIHASDHARVNATITDRKFEEGIVTYDLKIGQTDLKDVGLEEVLEYVSPYHLEEFENEQFKREEEMLRIVEEEERRYAAEQYERRKQRAKTKGTVIMQETSADDAVEEEVATGKHGRARPSYKPMFKKFKQRRRRRKRDPSTGELLPLSDEDETTEAVQEQESSSDDRVDETPGKDPLSLENLPKRRRRRRDPITGELMPLPPLNQVVVSKAEEEDVSDDGLADDLIQAVPHEERKKRPRRRRHPITNELMPLGWRYDPEAERKHQQDIKVPSIQRLSISKENEPKRRRLDQTTSPSGRSRSPNVATQSSTKPKGSTAHPLQAFKKGEVISLHGSDSEEDSAEEEFAVTPAVPKPRLLRRSVGGASIGQDSVSMNQERGAQSASKLTNFATLPVRISPNKATYARKPSTGSNSSIIPLQYDDEESSSEEEEEEEAEEPEITTTRKPTVPETSILHPSALTDEDSSSEDEDMPDDEYVVEKILSHAWSQPTTHPADMGKKPVMLYQVKWEGWTDPTWEPRSSFGDMEGLKKYQMSVGMSRSEMEG